MVTGRIKCYPLEFRIVIKMFQLLLLLAFIVMLTEGLTFGRSRYPFKLSSAKNGKDFTKKSGFSIENILRNKKEEHPTVTEGQLNREWVEKILQNSFIGGFALFIGEFMIISEMEGQRQKVENAVITTRQSEFNLEFRKELLETKKEVTETRKELQDGMLETRKDMSETRKEISETRKEISETRKGLSDGRNMEIGSIISLAGLYVAYSEYKDQRESKSVVTEKGSLRKK